MKKFEAADTGSFFLRCQTTNDLATVQVFQTPIPAEAHLLALMLVPVTPPAEKEALLAHMVNETSDVLTAADLKFRPITWSNAAERLYGISREQAMGGNLRHHLADIKYGNATVKEVRHLAWTTGKWRGEMSFTRPADGKRLTLLITFKLMRDNDGTPLHYLISATDITDRKETEAKLRESENRFREVADTAPVGIWMSEVENKVIYINKPLADYTGVAPDAFTKPVWISRIHPEDVDEVLKKFRDHFLQRKPVTLVYRLQKSSGAYHWVQDSGTPRFLSDGTFLGYIGSIVDIHDTKQREEQLQYQATLMYNVEDSVVMTDMNFIVKCWNRAAEEIYGYPAIEVMGKRQPVLSHFKYADTTEEQALADMRKNGMWRGEINIPVRGEERNFLFTATYVTDAAGKRIGAMALGRDITERKQAEKRLQASEAFYRSLIADSVDGKLLTHADGTITFASPSIQIILGYTTEALIGRNAFEFVHPDDQSIAWTAFQHEVASTPEVKYIEVRLLKQDGTWLWCMVRGHNMLDNPHISRIAISLHDDSQRKQAADALKESEQRFRTLIKDLQLAVLLENADGKVLMYNKATTNLFGVSEATLTSANVYDLFKNAVHEDGTPFDWSEWPMAQALRTRQPVNDIVIGVLVPGSDAQTWLLVNANPVLGADGQVLHIISSFKDITERKKLLQEQFDQQRLLAQATIDGQERERKEIGKELHDNIGQQLATTKLYLDLARSAQGADSDEMLARATKGITDAINEVRTISHSLVPPTLGVAGLVESVQDLARTISLAQGMHIEFTHRDFCETGLPENVKLMLYRIIQEALNNILKHAQASSVRVYLTSNKRFLFLEIQDNGRGFVPEKVRKGLGLNNIRNRAELLGGKVNIKAAPGAGCILKVVIPFQQAAPSL